MNSSTESVAAGIVRIAKEGTVLLFEQHVTDLSQHHVECRLVHHNVICIPQHPVDLEYVAHKVA